jgi:hypothetical protein
MKEALSSSETSVLQEPHGVTSQKSPFFIVTSVKTSNLTFVTSVQRLNEYECKLITEQQLIPSVVVNFYAVLSLPLPICCRPFLMYPPSLPSQLRASELNFMVRLKD